MVCCFLFSGDPGAVDTRGRYKTFDGPNVFQTPMMNAPCVNCPMSCCWCMGYVVLLFFLFFVVDFSMKSSDNFSFFLPLDLTCLSCFSWHCLVFSSCNYDFRQFIPMTCTCTQYALRVKALEGDMTKYSCFQGYFNCCCFRAGTCGEQSCPELCLCFESCCCNSLAISATRAMVSSFPSP